ncbi:XK-related protein 6-like isoform X2 [Limulus polyphemus]|uniref:XK-related protein n=1 Tax=Limulus polyphemus TaxID=6850 RepID=A0ABM1T2I6_LIMPO|nr:XK-related protein 6-like isoform X2 [Limulus polyphemus]
MDEKHQTTFDDLQKDEDVDHGNKCDGECYLDEKPQITSEHRQKDEDVDHGNKCDGECYLDEKPQITSEHRQKDEDADHGDKCDGECYNDVDMQDCSLTDEEPNFTLSQKLNIVAGIVLFIIDLFLDIVVCYQHYRKGDKGYFGITVAVIILSSLLHTLWSLCWYFKYEKASISFYQWIFRGTFSVLPLSPVLRFFEAFWYGIKIRRSNKESKNYYYDRFCSYFLDAVELRLAESFMESAPQLLIQAFIQIRIIPRNALQPTGQAYKDFIVRFVSIVSSLVSLAWSLVSYYSGLFMKYKIYFKMKIKIFMFLWHFFTIASRVMALVLFASFSLKIFSIYCGLRVVFVMSMNLGKGGRIFKGNCNTEDFLLSAVRGIISTFCYFNYKSAPIQRDYILYYTVTAIENTIFSMLWYSHSDAALLFRVPLMCFLFLSFSIGIIIMIRKKVYRYGPAPLEAADLASDYHGVLQLWTSTE